MNKNKDDKSLKGAAKSPADYGLGTMASRAAARQLLHTRQAGMIKFIITTNVPESEDEPAFAIDEKTKKKLYRRIIYTEPH